MNKTKIQELLQQWTELINLGKQRSIEKANKSLGGLKGRIKRTTGKPVIFDSSTYKDQQQIQHLLCIELPQLANLIRSQPVIMDGYSWIKNDFIDLYFEHFCLVVEKLQRIIGQTRGVDE